MSNRKGEKSKRPKAEKSVHFSPNRFGLLKPFKIKGFEGFSPKVHLKKLFWTRSSLGNKTNSMKNFSILIGRLGQNPRITTFEHGTKVADFSMATDQKWKDKNTGERRSKTTWHRVKCYRGLASVVERFLRKGSLISAQGMYLNKTYTDKEGIERKEFYLLMDDMTMLDTRRDSSPEPTPMTASGTIPATFQPGPEKKKEEDGSDDLPF